MPGSHTTGPTPEERLPAIRLYDGLIGHQSHSTSADSNRPQFSRLQGVLAEHPRLYGERDTPLLPRHDHGLAEARLLRGRVPRGLQAIPQDLYEAAAMSGHEVDDGGIVGGFVSRPPLSSRIAFFSLAYLADQRGRASGVEDVQ
jgi:hypothetical protein